MEAHGDRVDEHADAQVALAPPSDKGGTPPRQGRGARVSECVKHNPGLHAVIRAVTGAGRRASSITSTAPKVYARGMPRRSRRQIASLTCTAILLGALQVACAAGTSGAAAQRPAAADAGTPNRTGVTDAAASAEPAPNEAPAAARPPPTAETLAKASGAFSGALEKGLSAARGFAKSSGHDAAEQASIVLASLADAIETIPGAAARVSEQLTEVRFEAKRLHRSDRMSFSLPRWIKEGLTAAATALEAQSPQRACATFWIAQARASISAIDAKSGLAFQRALVQDALRTTLDAFVVAGQREGHCR